MKIFDKIRIKKPAYSKFDLSHERKMSLNMGDLVPIVLQEILPGDRFRVDSQIALRFAPMLAPIMHRVNVYTHYFFIPNRLVWNEWQDFITGGREGTSSPTFPDISISTATKNNFKKGTLADYFGIPTVDPALDITNDVTVSAIPFRAYQMVFNEYYRDQNLSAPVEFGLGSGTVIDGAEITRLCTMRKRAWEKDYFTSALPWAQRGPEVLIPMEGQGSVTYTDYSTVHQTSGTPVIGNGTLKTVAGTSGPDGALVNDLVPSKVRIENIDQVTVENTSVTINELRRSIRLQEWLEKNARGGARYIEQILSHFGVRSSDARLQRPEYLGGGKQPVTISEVLSSFQADDGDLPQGNMAGHGISIGRTNSFSRRFEEHGYVIGIMSVLPRTAYQQGIPKHFSRFNKLDFAWPEFANLGEQEIKLRELWWNPQGTDPEEPVETFGYTPRYAEYKFASSTVHGDFRDDLKYWHMGRIFENKPVLNESFITSDPTQRIFAVTDPAPQKLYCHIYNRIDAIRPLPYFGTPTI